MYYESLLLVVAAASIFFISKLLKSKYEQERATSLKALNKIHNDFLTRISNEVVSDRVRDAEKALEGVSRLVSLHYMTGHHDPAVGVDRDVGVLPGGSVPVELDERCVADIFYYFDTYTQRKLQTRFWPFQPK